MGNPDFKEAFNENRKKIEVALATAKRGMALSQIANETKIPLSTVKRHLDHLISIGRAHTENYGTFNVYYWNGEGTYQDKIFLSDNHLLFIDAMISQWEKPFIRIKESKKVLGEWKDMGAIIIDPEKIPELMPKLQNIEKRMSEYAASSA